MTSGALSGLLVVSLEQAVAAPFCSARLADGGARVIKIERPEGDFARGYDRVACGQSAYFVWLNRGKESIALDLKQAADRALMGRLVARADVFIQNLAPGAAGRLGFDSAALRAADPRLVTCDISGYGETGAYAGMKAYDLLVQAESGLASVTGRPEGPGRVGVSVCDIACGLYAALAVMEALVARQHSGQGRALKVSLFDAMADWMNVPLLHQVYGGKATGAARPQPPLDRTLRRLWRARRRGLDLDPERARMATALRRGAGAARRWPTTRGFATTRPGSPTGRPWTGKSRRCSAGSPGPS